MHGRERLMAIEARDAGLLATSLRMRDEVRNTADALTMVPHGKPDKQMIAIAEQIIAQKEGPFDPKEFHDATCHLPTLCYWSRDKPARGWCVRSGRYERRSGWTMDSRYRRCGWV